MPPRQEKKATQYRTGQHALLASPMTGVHNDGERRRAALELRPVGLE